MAATRSTETRRATVSVVLVLGGLALCLLYWVTRSSEQHSFAAGATASFDVTVTQGDSYSIGYPGGIDSETELGVTPAALTCTESQTNGATNRIVITPEQTGTKATNQIATFTAPVSGRVHIACDGLTSVFVDNADDAKTDYATLFLVLGSIALAIGLPLMLSVLRQPTRSAERTGGEHQVQ